MKNIIGRIKEQKTFRQILDSKQSEFIAVCGRRRVGKTYMIRQFFEKNIVFQHIPCHWHSNEGTAV